MHSFATFFVTALVASSALAAPTASKRHVNRHSFTVPHKHHKHHAERNGTAALIKAYNKFKWPQIVFSCESDGSGCSWSPIVPTPPSVAAAPATSTTYAADPTGVSSAENAAASGSSSGVPGDFDGDGDGDVTGDTSATGVEGNSEFLSPITIGGQSFNLDFDTGSADLWVYGSNSGASGHPTLDTSSSSFQPMSGYSFEISYGDGSSASGVVGTDTVSVGSATVSNQAVEVATQVSSEFLSDPESDGLLGLGFSNVNSVQPKQQKTFFDNIMPQLEDPVFTVYLNISGKGEYEFGNIDTSKYSGDIHYTPVDSASGYWQFDSTSYQINGVTSQNTNASPAIADTGTSLVLVDDEVLQAYYAKVPGAQNSNSAGGYIFPCTAPLPSFGVAIGSTGWYGQIPGDAINYAQYKGGFCFGGIQSNAGQGLSIYGDVFLRQVFTVFNGEEPKIGFANKP
ncbi:hypothetical protein MBLNU457_5573t1 [Dothideomycetes sp. NU457]